MALHLDEIRTQSKNSFSNKSNFFGPAHNKINKRSPLVIDMAKGCPTDLAIKANMCDLARYALIC